MVHSAPQGIDDKDINLVLEGGGVKGIGLIGALTELDAAGFRIRRVAGTSAGAIAAALVAANLAAGSPLSAVKDQIASIDYKKFTEESTARHLLGRFADFGALLSSNGMYSGQYLVDWLGGILDGLGIATFAQLRRDDLGTTFPYSLVVHTADVTSGKLVRLPSDYPVYRRDPDGERIVDAVRASMAIPFFFTPVEVEVPSGDGNDDSTAYVATWVDGGLLSNFPMEVFNDLHNGVVVDPWPTVGIKLASQEAELAPPDPTNGPLDEALQILKTVLNNSNRYFVTPAKARSTIFVDSAGLTATDFDITPEQCTTLFENGRAAAGKWLGQLREFSTSRTT